ncbi:hypothetical protein [Gynurincola endophyticus]|uniref:hypothetical protein n=1 Tax=Gynurincola endophyticus TaxID=2479004 RepID=UPI000F8CF9A2|nr:hypothetical protein [Gynurincola endophyticus]
MNRVKDNIRFYLPAINDIVGDTDFGWGRVEKLFSDELKKRTVKANGATLMIEATIYDIIIEVKKQNLQAMRLLSFFQRLLEELSINLTSEEKKIIKKNIRDLLTSFDLKFLNYVGELAVINNLIKSKNYRLEYVETKMVSGKSIDYRIKKLENGKLYLVEVLNIHLNSDKVENDEEKIKTFLNHRLAHKIESKKSDKNFFLIPVLWGGWQDIKIYSNYFKKNKMHLANVLEPVAYVSFTDPKDKTFYIHRFGNVSNLFDSACLMVEE